MGGWGVRPWVSLQPETSAIVAGGASPKEARDAAVRLGVPRPGRNIERPTLNFQRRMDEPHSMFDVIRAFGCSLQAKLSPASPSGATKAADRCGSRRKVSLSS